MNIDITHVLYSLPAVVAGLTVHEFAHAFIADKLGDDTAKKQGRISFNPIKHIDPLGMIFIILAGFGWAKPVAFNPEKLKKPKRDKIFIAIAGPLSNLFLGIIVMLFLKLLLGNITNISNEMPIHVINTIFYFIFINLGLFIFNILPIPPLDGSHIVFQGLNLSEEKEHKLIKIGSLGLIIMLFIESNFKIDIIPIGKAAQFIVRFFF